MRYWFGASIADWTFGSVTVGETPNLLQAAGGAPVTFWSAETGGSQYIDLQDIDGAPVTSVLSSAGGTRSVGVIPPVQGPDDVREMWASAGGGPRQLMRGRVDAVDRSGDRMGGPLVLADGYPAVSQAYAVSKAGDAMTGPLALPGAPTAANHAATKGYVDQQVAAGGGGGAVSSVNGETGAVTLDAADVGAAPSVHGHTTAQVTGLDAALANKAALAHDHPNRAAAYRHNGTGYVPATDAGLYVGPTDPGSVPDGSVWVDTSA